MIRIEQAEFPEEYNLQKKMTKKRKERAKNELFAEMLDEEMKKLGATYQVNNPTNP